MRLALVFTLAIMAAVLLPGGLAAVGFGLAAEGDAADWTFLFGLLAAVVGALLGALALILTRPTGRWPRLARRLALAFLGAAFLIAGAARVGQLDVYGPLLFLTGAAALLLLVRDLREGAGTGVD